MNKSTSLAYKIIAFFVFTCFFATSAKAQDNNVKQKSAFWQKVRFGGGIGLSTSNNIFSATLAPSAIYQFNNTFALGVGLSGSYLRNKNTLRKYKSTIVGGSIIGLYNPINEIQISGELEQNNVSRNFDDSSYSDENYWSPALFIGAGYRTRNITIGVKYDLLFDDNKSIYANAWSPFVRVYF
ncbi:alpha-ketoglutarate decarboxylase [Oceanihabitans sp. 1_MG-2023]|uniref:alpha-ketoglutarate decarboxylase n=1 Tax=Flavobacteriaceae TaxID=49546 RepID=UPI00209025F4|nr:MULTISPECIES: alpha-ketoglutarate decarboxylase [Flavobacteriaceae]MDO6621649.1 alpha-ketoglutarate decarboxylase [Oceanihabitans sp. 1_MG-2023]